MEFVAENDGNASDTTPTESKHSDEVIEKQRESSSDDSDESEMDQKERVMDTRRCKTDSKIRGSAVRKRKNKNERENRNIQRKQEEAG